LIKSLSEDREQGISVGQVLKQNVMKFTIMLSLPLDWGVKFQTDLEIIR